ncbi:transcription cofactor vestigial-like protein 1 [Rhinichthys klamathensis goyatoka]|uniref:transcription cofactor vestigial-like protein 1 n=1 Tax=Rhinichthys klamathensis goyatoka TaxID=3034132 RepID=UPI0024B55F6D|nr:transcription cofactor vestigial-like protein 1 [Rhinichthys klamathensis goyatoka]XP_056098337.1 transcription cofactor vestigial-like protein 1 [Rhinichthys klamathensis goyatoka]
MEEDLGSPVAKIKEESGSVLLTYFQGDINSMVDEHFSRALSKATKPKGEHSKMKRNLRSAQTNELGSNQWEAQSQTRFQPMFPPEHLRLRTSSESQSNHHMPPNLPANNAVLWSGDSRQGMSLALPPMMYPSAVSSDGLMVAEQQYSNSLLNLLHNDRPDMSTVMGPSSKQELMSGWTKYPGFGGQMACDLNLNSGVQVIEKKDLYWY